jgi:hypothetical protein
MAFAELTKMVRKEIATERDGQNETEKKSGKSRLETNIPKLVNPYQKAGH